MNLQLHNILNVQMLVTALGTEYYEFKITPVYKYGYSGIPKLDYYDVEITPLNIEATDHA